MKIPKVLVETGIIFNESSNKWDVFFKGVKFAQFEDLESAHERLNKLITLALTNE